MKNKMIAMILTTALIGGIGSTGATAFASEKASQSNCGDQNICSQVNTDKLCGFLGLNSNQTIQEILKKLGLCKSNCNIGESKSVCDSQSNCNTGENKPACNLQNNGGTENNKPNTETPSVVENLGETQTAQKPSTPAQKPDTPVQKPEATPVQKPEVTPAQKPSDTTQKPVANDNFMAQVESMIFNKVNEERAKAGVPALTYNNTMEKYARIKSQDMGDRKYFDHKDPQGNLITVKMQNDGVKFSSWGENIAYISGVSDATALGNQFMTNWMNSPGHRQNILSNNYSSIGVGVYKVGNTVYATQEFYR